MVRLRVRILFSHPVEVQKWPVPFPVHQFSRPDKYVTSLEGRLSDGKFSSVTCAENVIVVLYRDPGEDSIGRGQSFESITKLQQGGCCQG